MNRKSGFIIGTLLLLFCEGLLLHAQVRQEAPRTQAVRRVFSQAIFLKDEWKPILKGNYTRTYSKQILLDEKWTALIPNFDAISISFDWQGRMYVLGMDREIYVIQPRLRKWTALLPGVKVKSITVKPDGTVLAPDVSNSFIYSYSGGKWTKTPGFAEQIVATKDGKVYYRQKEGTVVESGNFVAGSGLFGASVKYSYMSAATKTNGLYLIDSEGNIYGYEPGQDKPSKLVGNGKAKIICGTGYGFRANIFIIGPGSDATVYYFEVTPTNRWVPIQGQTYMKFIALSPTGTLYGVGVDNKLYHLKSV